MRVATCKFAGMNNVSYRRYLLKEKVKMITSMKLNPTHHGERFDIKYRVESSRDGVAW